MHLQTIGAVPNFLRLDHADGFLLPSSNLINVPPLFPSIQCWFMDAISLLRQSDLEHVGYVDYHHHCLFFVFIVSLKSSSLCIMIYYDHHYLLATFGYICFYLCIVIVVILPLQID